MAKKKVAKKAATKKTAPAKGSKKKAASTHEEVEIKLAPVEQQAIDLVSTSDALCNDLELTVTKAVAKAVGTVYKKHKVNLTAAQAENVALILFGN
jgi:hypothetical protein